jgi:hypothetical protein
MRTKMTLKTKARLPSSLGFFYLCRFDFYTFLISTPDLLDSSRRELPFISRLTKRVLLEHPVGLCILPLLSDY